MTNLVSGGNGEAKTAEVNTAFLSDPGFPLPGNIFAPDNWVDPIMERLGVHPAGQNTTNTANLTQMVTQAQQAGSSHPSTQIIAAHLQRMATNGETRNMTLEMQPPELGRVKVRMEFDAKSKSVKAQMLIEKPETFLMLQRDAHVLERALQNAGLDVSDGSLNFELAQDGQQFTQDGSHDGNSNGWSGNDGSNGEEIGIIETTMNWYVDPETGMQRYDLLV